MTFGIVFRANELSNGDELGLFSLRGYQGIITPVELTWNFKLKQDTTSQLKIERVRSSGPQSNVVNIPSFENSNLVFVIRITGTSAEVFINGSLIDTFTVSYFSSIDRTSGIGTIFSSCDYDGTFESSFNGIFGEFLFY